MSSLEIQVFFKNFSLSKELFDIFLQLQVNTCMHLITLQNHELVELSKEVQNLQRCLLYEYVTIMILNCFASYSVDLTSKSSKVCNFFLYPKLQTHIFCQNIVTRLLHSTPYTIVSKRRKNAVKKKSLVKVKMLCHF